MGAARSEGMGAGNFKIYKSRSKLLFSTERQKRPLTEMLPGSDARARRAPINQANCEEKFACAPLLKWRGLRIGLRVLLFLLL